MLMLDELEKLVLVDAEFVLRLSADTEELLDEEDDVEEEDDEELDEEDESSSSMVMSISA